MHLISIFLFFNIIFKHVDKLAVSHFKFIIIFSFFSNLTMNTFFSIDIRHTNQTYVQYTFAFLKIKLFYIQYIFFLYKRKTKLKFLFIILMFKIFVLDFPTFSFIFVKSEKNEIK